MQYTTEITIGLPRERVVELFEDPESTKKWQPTLQSMEHLSGEPGQPGAKMKLVHDQNGREMEMIETIVSNDLPDSFVATYETDNVYNRLDNTFHETGDGKTRWVAVSEFRFSGFMKIMAFFMRGAFPRQTQQIMSDFKTFAESA